MTERDKLWLAEFAAAVIDSPPKLTAEEESVVSAVVDELGHQSRWVSLDDDIQFPKDKVHKDGDPIVIGRCVGVVQTFPEHLLGWIFHNTSDYDTAKHIKSNGRNTDLYPNIEVARLNPHHQITYQCRKLPFPLSPRDWLQRGIFKQLENDSGILCVYRPVDEKKEKVSEQSER